MRGRARTARAELATEDGMEQPKAALVTGGSKGIGRAVALGLLARGYRVTLAGRHDGALQQVVAAAGASPESALAVASDVTDPASVAALFAQHQARFGRLDLLFNNAGVSAPAIPMEEIAFDQWQAVIATNLTGAFLCTQQAFRMMKLQSPRGGRIINNGSVAAYVPRPHSAPYAASKHAITGLTRATSLDGRAFDIACGQIDIGNAASDMTQAMTKGVPQADGTLKVEPVMDVRHVADAVVHMASLPLDVNVQTITIMATKMPFVGRG
jgi:NAD(P)-dependent dehydrogenase (short-subunit alcohol dehydrogenase family)